MANQCTRADIYVALAKKCFFEVRQDNETPKQLRIIGKCDHERWPFMLPVIHALLTQSGQPTATWTCDISKMYIIRDGKVLYGWRIIFQGDELTRQYGKIIATIESAQRPARVEVESMLLPGYKPGQTRGGVNAKGKGASTAGTVPMAVQRLSGGASK
jgi:hypothetical protein